VNKKGVLRLANDPRKSDGKTGHVEVTVPSHPDLKATLDIPVRYDIAFLANFNGANGTSGTDGTSGAMARPGRAVRRDRAGRTTIQPEETAATAVTVATAEMAAMAITAAMGLRYRSRSPYGRARIHYCRPL